MRDSLIMAPSSPGTGRALESPAMRERLRSLLSILASALLLGAFPPLARADGGQPTAADLASLPVKSVADFGAVGDGVTDDAAALQRALSQSDKFCLDGGGRTYRLRLVLRAMHDLCLVNIRLVQDQPKFDLRPYLQGKCPPVTDPHTTADCGDRAIPAASLPELNRFLEMRTLVVRPLEPDRPIAVYMSRVTIDRGDDPSSGSRSVAAGLAIDHASSVELDNVEITGAGKGMGLVIADSSNIRTRGLFIHDLVWAPYPGEPALSLPDVIRTGWNSTTIQEYFQKNPSNFRSDPSKGPISGFRGMRVQEQLVGLMILRSQHVHLTDTRILNCDAQFREGRVPWQTDGIDVGESSSDIVIDGNTQISGTWEGIDVLAVGTGVRDLTIDGVTVTNSFNFGIKLGYHLTNATVRRSVVRATGIAGIIIYGPPDQITVEDVDVFGVGNVEFLGKTNVPWPNANAAGVLITDGGINNRGVTPQNVDIARLQVTGGGHCDAGLLIKTNGGVRYSSVTSSGCKQDIVAAQ